MKTITQLRAGIALAALVTALPVFAQTTPGQDVPTSPAAEIPVAGDIIVTAQRRSESLQSVPAAITAFSGEALARQGLNSVSDIATRTPSFVIGQQGPASSDLSIRGIGSSDRDAGSERSVIVFQDEIYTGRAGGIPADLFDLERVEVLRGPQGTLYGKNAVGGAVNLITRKPGGAANVNGEVSVGDYGLFQVRAAAGVPLSSTLDARIAFSSKRQNGFYRNTLFNARSDDYNLNAGRAQLRWRPSDPLDVLLSGDYAHDDVDGITTYVTATPALLATGFNPGSNPFVGSNNIFGFTHRTSAGTSLRADYDIGFATITSLTGYRNLKLRENRDLAGDPLVVTPTGTVGFASNQLMTEQSESFSQELRLTSKGSGPFTYVGGLYFQTEKTHRIEERQRQLNAAISRPRFDQENLTHSYAAFGQVSWRVAQPVKLTLGGRYTIDSKNFGLVVTNPFGYVSVSPASAVFSATGNDEWRAFTPKAVIDVDFARDILGYLSVSRGFKSGGYQGLAATAAAARTSFNPEVATSYEAGLKTRFFDRRVTINVAAYYTDFKDLQFRQRILTVPGDQSSAIVVVANAGKARIKGVEVESTFVATNWLSFNLNYSYIDSKITQFNATTGVTDVTGFRLARAPQSTVTAAVNLDIPVGDYRLGGRVGYDHRSSFWFEPSADPALLQPGYGLFDARVSVAPQGGRWSLEAWMRNIGNTYYRTFAQSIGFATGTTSAATTRTGDPRTFGFTARVKY